MRFIYPAFIAAFFLLSCNRQPRQNDSLPGKEDYTIMHFIVERTRTDTVKKYMDYFIAEHHLRTGFSGLADGEYSAVSPSDDFHYTHSIQLVVKNGELVSVHYDENGEDGHSKKDDEDYNAEMKASGGSCPKESYPFYEDELLRKQDLLEVDGLSGSTYSLYRMQLVGIRALNRTNLINNKEE
ncbi:MAG TPA: hypothetical protein VE870_05920 [Bacteroidales bacterium]|nr:hypothetical protein [Bacteroidales bacterium]